VDIATWNVNGIRARQAQVLEWLEHAQPDVVCLQEIKAVPDQVPPSLRELDQYWTYWHGESSYSGVALLIRKAIAPERPPVTHPSFDFETRIACVDVAGMTIASVYVPNGGKDYTAKMGFLHRMIVWARGLHAAFVEKPVPHRGDGGRPVRGVEETARVLQQHGVPAVVSAFVSVSPVAPID
jgi:exodeoxyribonuclease-3